ncbi:MFS transporter [Paenibacillus xylaniclasticus]|uniref:MFS transporter n=1 Tax=Paenibacillus xylaniclasticus TaxID=588083 RepID=UPI000FDCBC3A|nr:MULTISPECIES: MFS transporter [Paenibacillus]GFN32903.1 MFS transporter [Paenibacillus curdlanolyticus]
MRATTKEALWNKNFVAISLSSFFVFLTFYTSATTLPVYVKETLHGSEQQIGLSMTLFIVAAVLIRPFAGKWMERFGDTRIVFWSLLLFFLAAVYYLNIYSFAMLLLLRFVNGGSFAVATTSTNGVALKLIPESRKGEGISYFSLFMSLAMVIGPFIGLTVNSHYGYRALFVMCAGFSLLALGLGVMARTRTEQTSPTVPRVKKPLHWQDLIEVTAIPIGLAGFLTAFSYSGLTSFISVYASSMSMESIASYFFVCFGVMIVLPRPLIGRILDRYSEKLVIYPSIAILAIGLYLLGQAQSQALFLAAGAVSGLGYGALLPSFQTNAVKRSARERQPIAMATFFVLFDLGYGIGSYVLGVIASSLGYDGMYLISAVVTALTALLYYALHRKKAAPSAVRQAYETAK